MQDLNVDINLYKFKDPADIHGCISHAIKSNFGDDVDIAVCNGCTVLLGVKNNKILRSIDSMGIIDIFQKDINTLYDPILKDRGILLGLCDTSGKKHLEYLNYWESLQNFRKDLIKIENNWIQGYIPHLRKSLTERISEGIPIIKHDAVRLDWALLVEKQETLNQITENFSSSNINTNLANVDLCSVIPELIRKICEIMSKLAGGRAYLVGQAVEMLWLFNIINKIYFTEGEKHE